MDRKISCISLFCGCGGLDLGMVGDFEYLDKYYEPYNIDIVHASDIDQKAVNTYNLNFEEKAICKDVLEIDFSDMNADIVTGGFPCKNFSTVNPNKRPDDRNSQLFWELADVVDVVRPEVVIAENVKGFYYLKKGKYFKMIKNRFEDMGYTVSEKIENVSEFGIPQKRERIFIVAVKKGEYKKFEFPTPTHGPNSPENKPYVVLDDVIDSLVPPDEKYYFSERAVEGVKRAKDNMERALDQDLSDRCLTITSHLAKVSLNSRDPVLLVNEEEELYRRFTHREAARIQSFPESFKFAGSEYDAYRQIGNAVPPVYGWHLTKSVINQFFKS